jgi:hypothetical protein
MQKEALKEKKKKEFEDKKLKECTFVPKINQNAKILSKNRPSIKQKRLILNKNNIDYGKDLKNKI